MTHEQKTKIEKDMPEFVSEVQSLDSSTINDRLAQLAKDAEAVEDSKDADEGLEEARESARLLAAPYADAKKAIRLKSRYLISLLKDRGEVA